MIHYRAVNLKVENMQGLVKAKTSESGNQTTEPGRHNSEQTAG